MEVSSWILQVVWTPVAYHKGETHHGFDLETPSIYPDDLRWQIPERLQMLRMILSDSDQ